MGKRWTWPCFGPLFVSIREPRRPGYCLHLNSILNDSNLTSLGMLSFVSSYARTVTTRVSGWRTPWTIHLANRLIQTIALIYYRAYEEKVVLQYPDWIRMGGTRVLFASSPVGCQDSREQLVIECALWGTSNRYTTFSNRSRPTCRENFSASLLRTCKYGKQWASLAPSRAWHE